MHAASPKTVVNDLGKQCKSLSGCLLAGVLLHVVTAVERILFLAKAGIDPHRGEGPTGMMQSKNRLRLVLLIAAALMSESVLAYEEVEDRVDILATDDAFIAVVDGRRNFVEDRRSGETTTWQGAKGEVGAFLTSDRILGISVTSGQWNKRYLKINEKKIAPQVLLAKHLVVMFSDERILGFGTHTGGFFQERLPLGEPVVASAAEGQVAAVITADRAFGLSTFRRGAAEIRFQIREQFRSVSTTYSKISLRTSRRLITFTAGDAVWRDIDLD